MSIQSVLAVVAVSDLTEAKEFYSRLLGRPADVEPMPSLAQWDLSASGGLQVVELPDQAGRSLVTLLLDDFDADVSALGDLGFSTSAVIDGVVSRLTTLTDPSGNTITLAATPS